MQIMFLFVESPGSMLLPPERPCRTCRVLLTTAALSAALVVAILLVGEVRLQVQSLLRPLAAFSDPLRDVMRRPGVCIFQVDASTEIILSPSPTASCDDGTSDTVRGVSPGSWVGPFPISTEGRIDASAISCSLSRPTDGRHLWVATDGSVAGARVCTQLGAIGWR
jgi:hypothetical protein